MKSLALALILAAVASAQMRVVTLPGKSPLVTFRIVFTTGSAADPAEKPGLARLTAAMLAGSGSKDLTYQQILDARFPMASSLNVQVDHEMTTFSGVTHIDNLTEYYKLLHGQLLDPGWRAEDFSRVKDEAINALRVGLRSNDEELGKEVMFSEIFAGTAYGHYSLGTVSSLEKITLEDVQQFYHTQYSQSNLIVGLAGGYPPAFLEQIKKDFRDLPQGAGFRPRFQLAKQVEKNRLTIVERDTRSVAFSFGFPLAITRESADFAPLLLAASYLGQHRMSGGVLYDEIREKRGINYGDYAYIEYFPRGMYLMEPSPNLARRQQIFQIWIRPVEPPTAKFALRMAVYQLNKLVKEGIPEDGFQRTREFLTKYVNILTRTKSAELGYAIDSMWYGTQPFAKSLRAQLAKLTREDVNRAIRRNLHPDRLTIVAVSKNAAELQKLLLSDDPSPMPYNSPKPTEVTELDKIVEKWPLDIPADRVKIIQGTEVFQ